MHVVYQDGHVRWLRRRNFMVFLYGCSLCFCPKNIFNRDNLTLNTTAKRRSKRISSQREYYSPLSVSGIVLSPPQNHGGSSLLAKPCVSNMNTYLMTVLTNEDLVRYIIYFLWLRCLLFCILLLWHLWNNLYKFISCENLTRIINGFIFILRLPFMCLCVSCKELLISTCIQHTVGNSWVLLS
jgi:hypothetical protein